MIVELLRRDACVQIAGDRRLARGGVRTRLRADAEVQLEVGHCRLALVPERVAHESAQQQ